MLIAALLTVPAQLLAAPVTTANDLCAPAANPCVVNMPLTVTTGSVLDIGTRELRIAPGGALDVFSGAMTLRAGLFTVQAGGFVRATGTASSPGGEVRVEATSASIAGVLTTPSIDASGSPGGTVTLLLSEAITVSGAVSVRALARDEVGGTIEINAGSATISGLLRATGGPEQSGGDITIGSIGDVRISGNVDASGGDGGTIEIEAGVELNQGNLVLEPSAIIVADAQAAGGFGGSIDLGANGDGIENGNIEAAGMVSVLGRTGSEEIGGGLGGEIAITAQGGITNFEEAALFNADGGGPDGDGGEIELSTDNGGIELQGTATASAPGEESTAGAVTLDAAGSAIVRGAVLVTAGDGGGGEATITSGSASVLLSEGSLVDASCTSGAAGGSISIESGSGVAGSRSVVIEGELLADGGPSGGPGGSIDVTAGDALRIASTAMVRVNGGIASGPGGDVVFVVDGGPAVLEGPLMATGGSPAGAGGIIAVDGQGRITVTAPINARGFGRGGSVGLSSSGGVEVRSGILASSSTAGGGSVEVLSQGAVQIAGAILADGVTEPGGRIEVTGCEVTLCGELDSPACSGTDIGVLSSLGPLGVNRVVGRDSSAILGTMRAAVNGGRNELVYDGTPARAPFFDQGTITPPAVVIVDASVLPCPACGNRVVDPPETCDDGNELDGDGCSATCQLEAPIPGDANGDFILSDSDIRGLISELFDGDGDSIAMVSGGAFPGGLGADANDDDRVTAADIPAIISLLFAP